MKDTGIASIIPRYGELNKLYKKIIGRGLLYFNEQESITAFYKEVKEVDKLESSVIGLILSGDKGVSSVLLRSLK